MMPAIIVTAVFLGLSFLVAVCHRRYTLQEVVLNNCSTGVPLLAMTLVATYVGGGLTTALIHFGYKGGVVGILIGISYSLAFIFLGGLSGVIKKMSVNHGFVSFADFIEHTHGLMCSRIVRVIYFFVFLVFLAAQFVALGMVLKVLYNTPFNLIVITSALVIIAYTALSGLRGVIFTDAFQLAILGLILFAFILPRTLDGGLLKFNSLPPGFLNGLEMGPVFALGTLLFSGLSLLVRIDAWQRILAARDAETARKGFVWAGIIILPFFVGYTLIGMDAYLIDPTLTTEDGVISSVFHHYFSNPWALALVSLSFLAAIVSSADSILNVLAVNMTRDWPSLKKYWAELKTDGQQSERTNKALLKAVRIFTLVIGLLGLALALLSPHIILLIVGGTSGMLVFLPVTLGGLILKQPKPSAGITSVLCGISSLLVLMWFIPTMAFVPALLFASIAYILTHKYGPT
jgi:solute:Na+ symporter, SSS family